MRPSSRGMTLIETLVALALLGIGILMAGSIVLWANRIEERSSRRVAALELAGNVAEQLRAVPYSQVLSGELDPSGLLGPAGLEEPVVELEVAEEDEELGLKSVRVIVSWAGEHPGRFVLVTAIGRGEIYR